jgi:hypothetical protein
MQSGRCHNETAPVNQRLQTYDSSTRVTKVVEKLPQWKANHVPLLNYLRTFWSMSILQETFRIIYLNLRCSALVHAVFSRYLIFFIDYIGPDVKISVECRYTE